MKKQLGLIGCGLVAAVIVTALNSRMQADESAAGIPADGLKDLDFKGKIVLFAIGTPDSSESQPNSVMLVDPEVEHIGGKQFVRGKQFIPEYMEAEYGFYKDVDTAIAMDKIDIFYAFNPDQLDKFIEYWKSQDDKVWGEIAPLSN